MRRALTVLCLAIAVMVTSAPAGHAAVPPALPSCPHATVVAVDFGHWGGPILRGCASAPSGLALLDAVGIHAGGDTQDGLTFVCRLADPAYDHGRPRPTPAEDPCIVTPPAHAYWSYWIAPPGQNHWGYAQLGPEADRPVRGGVELWRFGGTSLSGASGDARPPYGPAALRGGATRVDARRVIPIPAGAATATTAGTGGPTSLAGPIAGAVTIAALLLGAVTINRRRRREEAA